MSEKDAVEVLRQCISDYRTGSVDLIPQWFAELLNPLESVLDELEQLRRLEAALQEVVFVQGEIAYECSRRADGWHVTKNDDGDLSYVGVWDSLPKFAAIKKSK